MDNSRRSFIKNGSIILAGASLLNTGFIDAENKKQEKLAIQLFSFDKQMHEDAAGTLTTLRKAGYRYIEHAGYEEGRFYGFRPAAFRRLVNDCGLTLLSGHTVLKLQHWDKKNNAFTKEWHRTIADAWEAGQQYIISPWLDKSLWSDEKELKDFMGVFNRSGELCKKAGLQFGYHNHDFEFTQTLNSVRLYDIILQHTAPSLVCQQLDIGNIALNDFEIATLFDQYPGRFQLMHVKNIIATQERHRPYKSAPIASGILNIPAIIKSARLAGGTFNFITEQDSGSGSDKFECAKENYIAFNKVSGISYEKAQIRNVP